MRVKCIKRFLGFNHYTEKIENHPLPEVGNVYNAVRESNFGFVLEGFPSNRCYDKQKFEKVTSEDFQFENIEEILEQIEEQICEPVKKK